MPLLREDSNLVGAIGLITDWRRSIRPPQPPFEIPTIPRVGYGCMIIEPEFRVDYTLRNRTGDVVCRQITLRQGMFGYVLEIRKYQSQIRLMNLYWNNKPVDVIVPTRCIRGGQKKYTGRDVWDIATRIRAPSAKLCDAEVTLPDNKGPLYTAISTYLQLIQKTQPAWMPSSWSETVGAGGENIPDITETLVNGVKNARLFDSVLNKDDGFSIQDMLRKGRPITEQNKQSWKDVPMLYFIYYEQGGDDEEHGDSDNTNSDDENTTDVRKTLYVGKTKDVVVRLTSYNDHTNNPDSAGYHRQHSILRRKATRIVMCALCVFDKDNDYYDLHGLAEQVFVSLLHTYRSALRLLVHRANEPVKLESEAGQARSENSIHVQHASYFLDVAKETVARTGFVGGVRNPDKFGVRHGMNWTSPYMELAATGAGQQSWVRQDSFAIEQATGHTYPIANFTLSGDHAAIWNSSSQLRSQWFQVHVFNTDDSKSQVKNFAIATAFTLDTPIDEKEWPTHGTRYTITIQARLDWEKIENSYARLGDFSPYADWRRANSWAVKLDWEDSTGTSRHRFMQRSVNSTHGVSEVAPANPIGASIAYERGITFSHYLFGDPRISNVWSIGKIRPINVRHVIYGYEDFTVTVGTQARGDTGPVPPPNGDLKSDTLRYTELRSMAAGKLDVDASGATTSVQTSYRNATRSLCDACQTVKKPGQCNRKPGKLVCTVCEEVFGLPRCTFTDGVRGKGKGRTWADLIEDNDDLNMARRRLLIDQCPWDDADTKSRTPSMEVTLLPRVDG